MMSSDLNGDIPRKEETEQVHDETRVAPSGDSNDLEETEEIRDREVKALLEWIKSNSDIPNFTDMRYILAFLRASKFNQTQARERIAKYWASRKHGLMSTMNDLDPASAKVLNILRGPHVVYLPLPEQDIDGRAVLMARWDQLDISGSSYTFDEWFRAITLIFDTLCFVDEDVMTRGVTFLMDATGVSLKHLLFFGFNNSRKQFDVMQKGYPIRIKKVHYFNNSSIIALLFKAVKTVLSAKLRDRIELHGYNMEPVFENIGRTNMPEDYLTGNSTETTAGSGEDIMDKFIREKMLEPKTLAFLRALYKAKPGDSDVKEQTSHLVDGVSNLSINSNTS